MTIPRSLVDDELPFGEETVYVGTQEALASHLGVDRKSIARWQKHKDCPGRVEKGYNLRDWKAFVQRNNLGRTKQSHSNKANLENEKIALANERARLVNAKLRGEVASQEEVSKVLADLLQGFVVQFTQLKHTLAEEVSGLPQGEVVKRLDRRFKELLGEISLGSWAQKKTFWSAISAQLSDLHRTLDLGRGAKST